MLLPKQQNSILALANNQITFETISSSGRPWRQEFLNVDLIILCRTYTNIVPLQILAQPVQKVVRCHLSVTSSTSSVIK